jgi:O-antigen/teichoic acid export membrane protein
VLDEAAAPSRRRDAATSAVRSLPGRVSAVLRVPLYRNGYALIVNSALTAIAGFAFWILAARRYSTHDVGAGSAMISAMLFASGLSQLNLLGFLSRFLPVAGSRTKSLILRCYGITGALTAVVATGFMIIERTTSRPVFPVSTGFAIYFVVATVAWTIFSLQDGVMTGLRNASWVPLENLVFGVGKIALIVLFAGTLGAAGLFMGWTLAMIVMIPPVNYLIFRVLVKRYAESPPSAPHNYSARDLFRFASGDYVGSLCAQASTVLLPFLVVRWAGPKQGGYFAIVWVTATSIDMVAFNFATSLTVEGAIERAQLRRILGGVMRHWLVIIVPAVALMIAAAPLVLSVFGQGYATQGTALLRVCVLACVPRGVNAIAVGVARIERNVRRIVAIQCSTAAIVLPLGFVLVHDFGLIGIGIAWLTAQVAVAAFVLPGLLRVLSSRSMAEPISR